MIMAISKYRGKDYNYHMGSTLKAQLATEIKTEHRQIWNSSMCGESWVDLLSSYVLGTNSLALYDCG